MGKQRDQKKYGKTNARTMGSRGFVSACLAGFLFCVVEAYFASEVVAEATLGPYLDTLIIRKSDASCILNLRAKNKPA